MRIELTATKLNFIVILTDFHWRYEKNNHGSNFGKIRADSNSTKNELFYGKMYYSTPFYPNTAAYETRIPIIH